MTGVNNHINSYIKCKWIKHFNKKTKIGKMDFKQHSLTLLSTGDTV